MAESAAGPPPSPWLPDRPEGRPVDPALGGELRVGPPRDETGLPGSPGAVVVASDRLLAHAARLDALAGQLAADAASLASLPPPAADLIAALPSGLAGGTATSVAQVALRAAATAAERARDDLRLAIGRYTEAEAAQRARIVQLGEQVGALLGPALRTIVALAVPALLAARATGMLGDPQVAAVRAWLLAHPELITSPAFVEAVRATAMGADEAVSSTAGLPPATLQQLGAQHGFEGVEAGAGVLVGLGAAAGMFRETPVSVDRVSTMPGERGPQGAVERLARVPEREQVRIERYEAPGEPPRYIVYVGPTETFSPVARAEPWDLTSNVVAVAGLSAGSERATVAAMHDAGIGSHDAVQFVGFSQGGLIATRLAASGEWATAGLETYGAPAGGIELPSGLHGMAVRNTDDLVPALAGPQLDHHLLQVERQAFAPGSPIPDDLPAPAHQRSAYVATATEIDRAASPDVRQQVAAMDAFTTEYTERDGSRVTVFTYLAERGAERALGDAPIVPDPGAPVSSGASPSRAVR